MALAEQAYESLSDKWCSVEHHSLTAEDLASVWKSVTNGFGNKVGAVCCVGRLNLWVLGG